MRRALPCVLLLALLASAPLQAAGPRSAVAGVPAVPVPGTFTVLCYHEVRDVKNYADPFAVNASALVKQFAWLRGNGYAPVSLGDVIAAREGGKPLPPKAVLLSFDDAYRSFYTSVYPLLRAFGFPAVLGVVGRWIESPRQAPALVDDKGTATAASFATWSQLREMSGSGLVEIASHTYDLHRGVPANPQGNLEPAATARIYSAGAGYEDDTAWYARVRADLARNSDLLERETGRRPRAMVWPYGSYNGELIRIAGELGMTVALTLEDGANDPQVPLAEIRRTLVEHNPALPEFTIEERGPLYAEPLRVVQVDLDTLYSADPAVQERNLSALLDRVETLQPTHVFLGATADTDGDGIADAAYFPNRHLPLRADLFNRVAWQLATRTDVKVFAVVGLERTRLPSGQAAETYEDLARHASIDGLVFEGGLAAPFEADAGTLALTLDIAARARRFRAPLKTVRVTAESRTVAALLANYDYVELAAGPADALMDPALRRKVIFMSSNRPGDGSPAARMRSLQIGGRLNFGYAGEDAAHGSPPLEQTAPALSLRVYPQTGMPEK